MSHVPLAIASGLRGAPASSVAVCCIPIVIGGVGLRVVVPKLARERLPRARARLR